MEHSHMISKIKAIFINFGMYIAVAVVAAVLEFSNTVDWTGFGIFGPAIGLAVAGGLDTLVGYLKRSRPEDFGQLGGDPKLAAGPRSHENPY